MHFHTSLYFLITSAAACASDHEPTQTSPDAAVVQVTGPARLSKNNGPPQPASAYIYYGSGERVFPTINGQPPVARGVYGVILFNSAAAGTTCELGTTYDGELLRLEFAVPYAATLPEIGDLAAGDLPVVDL